MTLMMTLCEDFIWPSSWFMTLIMTYVSPHHDPHPRLWGSSPSPVWSWHSQPAYWFLRVTWMYMFWIFHHLQHIWKCTFVLHQHFEHQRNWKKETIATRQWGYIWIKTKTGQQLTNNLLHSPCACGICEVAICEKIG